MLISYSVFTLKTSMALLLLLFVVSSDLIIPAINKLVQYCMVRALKSLSFSDAVSDAGIDWMNQFISIWPKKRKKNIKISIFRVYIHNNYYLHPLNATILFFKSIVSCLNDIISTLSIDMFSTIVMNWKGILLLIRKVAVTWQL